MERYYLRHNATVVANGYSWPRRLLNDMTRHPLISTGCIAVIYIGAGWIAVHVPFASIGLMAPQGVEDFYRDWPAAGSADTELGVLLEPEVGHGATEVYARIQARGGEADQGAWGKCRAGLARSGCARDSAAQLGEGVCG